MEVFSSDSGQIVFFVVFLLYPVERVMIITLSSCGDCCACGAAHRAES